MALMHWCIKMIKYRIYKKLSEVTETAIDKLQDFQYYLRDLQIAELDKALLDAEFSKETNALFKKVFG